MGQLMTRHKKNKATVRPLPYNLQLSREFPQDFRYYFKPGTPIHVHPVLSTNHTRALGDMKIS